LAETPQTLTQMTAKFTFDKSLEHYISYEHVDFLLTQIGEIISEHCNHDNNFQFIEKYDLKKDLSIIEPFFLMDSVVRSSSIYVEMKYIREELRELAEHVERPEKSMIMVYWKNLLESLKKDNHEEGIKVVQRYVVAFACIIPLLTELLKNYTNYEDDSIRRQNI
jgi:hypothetical protein